MDLIDSFYEGYQAGLFLGGLLTLVAAINVKIFVVVFLGISIANAAAGITYLIAGVSKKNSKVALVGCALLVTAVASIFGSLGMMTEVFASGDKGSIEFTLDFTDMDNAVIEQGGSGGCFIAGTKIKTYGGEKNIEDIEVGDEVYAYNPDTGEIGLKKVCRIFTHGADEIAHVTIDGETIDATTNHPFYVVGYGFKAAGELKVGDKVLLLNGDIKEVTDIEIEHLEEAVTVYNFEVEDWHTYYVSDYGVLVHNMCWETSGGSGPDKVLGGSFKDVNATRGTDEVAHHMPQNAFNKTIGISRNDGPSLLMSTKDHALTRTFAGKGKGTMVSDAGLTARQRLYLDAMDIRNNFGSKYDKGLLEMIKYAKTLVEYQ